MKNLLRLAILISSFIFLFTACSYGKNSDISNLKKDTNKNKNLPVIGENVKFNPNKLINNGKPISIELWTWGDKELWQGIVKGYTYIYPNVNIKVVVQPWSDYWTKLPLSLRGNNGPALFNVHNSNHENIINYMAPYNIDIASLEKDFIGVKSHIENGRAYYIDYAINTGNIYYNKSMWKEAGLTDKEFPKTWDEFTQVAKKLTKRNANDKLIRAGFNFNGTAYQALIEGLNYQKGELLFKEDKKTVNFNNKTTIENTKYLVSLYNDAKVGSPDFGDDYLQSFGNGQSAMIYGWGSTEGELKRLYPEIDFGVFETPTPTKDIPFAYDRYNGESTPGINKNAPKEEQEVAQDFVRYFLANNEIIKTLSLKVGSFPAKYSLGKDKDILADPALLALSKRVENYIFPGPFPSTIETTSGKVFQNIFYNKVPIEKAVDDGENQMKKDMKYSTFKSVEDKYKFYSKLKDLHD